MQFFRLLFFQEERFVDYGFGDLGFDHIVSSESGYCGACHGFHLNAGFRIAFAFEGNANAVLVDCDVATELIKRHGMAKGMSSAVFLAACTPAMRIVQMSSLREDSSRLARRLKIKSVHFYATAGNSSGCVFRIHINHLGLSLI